MTIEDLWRDMHDSLRAARRAELALGTRRREDYFAYTRSADAGPIRPSWWRPFARIRHARMLRTAKLQARRFQVIGACDSCVWTFASFNLPCGIHQADGERELAFELVRLRRIRESGDGQGGS
jgi:hypothetical protein